MQKNLNDQTNISENIGASSSKEGGSNFEKLAAFKRNENLRYKTEGPNGKQIGQFYQRHACTRGNDCRYAHVCWRCHKPGHAILECTTPPKSK